MARTYTGKVTAVSPGRLIDVLLDGPKRPTVGTPVELRVLLTDEEIGRRLREMLTLKVDKRSVRDMATDVENDVGWPILADLIREVIDA